MSPRKGVERTNDVRPDPSCGSSVTVLTCAPRAPVAPALGMGNNLKVN